MRGQMTARAGRGKGASPCSAPWRCPTPTASADRYPHQVSGGQLQRADGGHGADDRPGAGHPRRADHRARRHHPGRGAARLPRRGARARHHRASMCRTTWPWWRRWPTASSCCATAHAGSRRRPPQHARRARATPTRAACSTRVPHGAHASRRAQPRRAAARARGRAGSTPATADRHGDAGAARRQLRHPAPARCSA